jgi:predicted nucleic acid-binding Zn ribbon protein
MIYPFHCSNCGRNEDIIRTIDECHLPAFCICGERMDRVFTTPQVNVPATGYYDLGLGTTINNARDKRDAIRRIRDNTGMSLVEAGNEDIGKHCKPQIKDYDVPRGIFDNAISE